MSHTTLSFLTNDELLLLTTCKDDASELEKELAFRLRVSLGHVEDLEEELKADVPDMPMGMAA